MERTAFAERKETKGHYLLGFDPTADGRGRLTSCQFVPLPARPMTVLDLTRKTSAAFAGNIRSRLASLEPDSVVCLNLAAAPPRPCCRC